MKIRHPIKRTIDDLEISGNITSREKNRLRQNNCLPEANIFFLKHFLVSLKTTEVLKVEIF